MPHDVFISHSSKDRQIAEAVFDALERHGIRCWLDTRSIRAGFDYAEEIMYGIENCPIFLLLYSEDSNNSKYVFRELERAAAYDKQIIPYRLSDVKMSKNMEFLLSSPQWIFVADDDAEYTKLASAVRGILQGESPDDGAEPTPPAPGSAPGYAPSHAAPGKKKGLKVPGTTTALIAAFVVIAVIANSVNSMTQKNGGGQDEKPSPLAPSGIDGVDGIEPPPTSTPGQRGDGWKNHNSAEHMQNELRFTPLEVWYEDGSFVALVAIANGHPAKASNINLYSAVIKDAGGREIVNVNYGILSDAAVDSGETLEWTLRFSEGDVLLADADLSGVEWSFGFNYSWR